VFIIPGLYLIKPYSGSNIYAISDKDGIYIIDTGFEGNDELIFGMIDAFFGAEPEDIVGIILTHGHPDHVGSLPEIIDISGADVYIHEKDLPLLEKYTGLKDIPNLITLKGGEVLNVLGGLKVIHAPGHTDGSIMLYKEGEILFTGDVLLTDKDGEIKLPLHKYTKDMKKEIASMLKIKAFDFHILLPGHGPPILERAKERYLLFLEKFRRLGRLI